MKIIIISRNVSNIFEIYMWRGSLLVKSAFSLQLYWKMNSLNGIFQGFYQLYRNIYLKEHLWTAASDIS